MPCPSQYSIFINQLNGLRDPENQCRIYKSFPIIPILSRTNLIPVLSPISLWSILIFSFHLQLGLTRDIFPVGLPVKFWKHLYLLPSWLHALPILILKFIIIMCIFVWRQKLWSSSLWAFSTPNYHRFWTQIFVPGSCFQIPLTCIPTLMKETMFHSHRAQLTILLLCTF